MSRPVPLLIVTGLLLGLIFPMGKIAVEVGVSPLVWTFLIAAGSGLGLMAPLLRRQKRRDWPSGFWRYATISGLVSNVLPNLIVFAAAPRLGAGQVGLMFTLSPVCTLALSLAAGMRRPSSLALTGVFAGFAGAVILVLGKGETRMEDAPLLWLALALLIPVFLAVGNIYRGLAWPEGAGAAELASASNLTSALMLLAGLVVMGDLENIGALMNVPMLTGLQVVLSCAYYVALFALQRAGGPVYLSQIGYVGAAVALIVGVVALDEHYGALTWTGAAIVLVGIGFAVRDQLRVR
ncbi:DMT family transporter [Notoacmeibacter ruber]|uniref:DMT family transporter n=1 Tax=Notoacmeibacter ruber TaxID=2670375 RepID=A0A3L7JHJ0_9HYPH|nr:DMT family transporter [Notoacmeibacter ruber]RLQ89091.1 DMT family transporter [Notoacmeibacter ruber]